MASGSESGGDVFGAALTYSPTQAWSFAASADVTINHGPPNAVPSTQAINIPGVTPLQIPTTSSTEITSTTLSVSYLISPQWSATGLFAFTHVDNIGSPIWNDSFVGDARLSYAMSRNIALSWDYQYSAIVSNAPASSASRNMVLMTASYKF
jgi:hypothetical protein